MWKAMAQTTPERRRLSASVVKALASTTLSPGRRSINSGRTKKPGCFRILTLDSVGPRAESRPA
jgi:hypothetical protein